MTLEWNFKKSKSRMSKIVRSIAQVQLLLLITERRLEITQLIVREENCFQAL